MDDAVARDQGRAMRPWIARGSQQFGLGYVAGGLSGVTRGPSADRFVESTAYPPLGISAREMQRELVSTDAFALAHPVRGKHAPLADVARREELHVLRVELTAQWSIVGVIRLDLVAFSES